MCNELSRVLATHGRCAYEYSTTAKYSACIQYSLLAAHKCDKAKGVVAAMCITTETTAASELALTNLRSSSACSCQLARPPRRDVPRN